MAVSPVPARSVGAAVDDNRQTGDRLRTLHLLSDEGLLLSRRAARYLS